jgi:hypothetical protein
MSQRNLVMQIDRIHEADFIEALSDAQVRVFQVSLADLTKLDPTRLRQPGPGGYSRSNLTWSAFDRVL